MGLNVLGYQFYLLQRYHTVCGREESSHPSPVITLQFLSRCKFRTLTTRQPMVEFKLLAFSSFHYGSQNIIFGFHKNRTQDFRTILLIVGVRGVRGYLLDHSGDKYSSLAAGTETGVDWDPGSNPAELAFFTSPDSWAECWLE